MWVPESGMTPKQIEKELERQKILFEEQVKTGILPDKNIRFCDFAKRWMDEYAKINLAIKTYARYEIFLDRINQAIGHIKLKDLKPLHLNQFYRNLEEDGVNKRTKGKLAPKTVRDHHMVISTILATAVKWQLLDQNVAKNADPPGVPHKEISYLNETETRDMILALEKEPIHYRTMIILLIHTGLRRGELCGLEWKDFDLDEKRMRIVRSSQYIGNKTIVPKEPKTKSGIRELSIGATVCQMLREYRFWQTQERFKVGDQWNDTDRLFTQWNGLPIHPDTVTDWFKKFILKNKFPYVTLHSLRHTNATLMLAEGVDIATLSKRLGHANTATSLNIYAHALRSKDTEAADKLENALNIQSKAV
jgi:integrase